MWDTGAAGDYSALNSGESESEEENETLEENEETEVCDALEQTKNESSICKSFYFFRGMQFYRFRRYRWRIYNNSWTRSRYKSVGCRGRDNHSTTHRTHRTHHRNQTSSKCRCRRGRINDVTVISASEDGSIKEWSISKDKGRLELHHLLTGQLYCNIMAHSDPVDTLIVYDTYICTAVYDKPGSLKIWQLKWGKMVCIYNLEETVSVEFNTFTVYGDLLLLGDASEQKLHMISFMTADTDCLKLLEKPGHVQHIAVTEGLLLVSSTDLNKIVHLHGE
ncbi:WD_REPEATS_REGION domain-containing protein [Caerostris extrusa]|uniref:WD_REPEATS_REGION domain-containing protein n=1 Tax=Caerostris extrusa TaxID=172846 RepID=A0AAV4MBR8_CAEEX|nr:WD_REPEATS_REGION domain-containing protein [Caerostris extrusa]